MVHPSLNYSCTSKLKVVVYELKVQLDVIISENLLHLLENSTFLPWNLRRFLNWLYQHWLGDQNRAVFNFNSLLNLFFWLLDFFNRFHLYFFCIVLSTLWIKVELFPPAAFLLFLLPVKAEIFVNHLSKAKVVVLFHKLIVGLWCLAKFPWKLQASEANEPFPELLIGHLLEFCVFLKCLSWP